MEIRFSGTRGKAATAPLLSFRRRPEWSHEEAGPGPLPIPASAGRLEDLPASLSARLALLAAASLLLGTASPLKADDAAHEEKSSEAASIEPVDPASENDNDVTESDDETSGDDERGERSGTTVLEAPTIDVTAAGVHRDTADKASPTSAATKIEIGGADRATIDIGRAISRSPGVTLRRSGAPGSPITASIRGSAADQVVVTLAGLPITPPGGGAVDLSAVPPSLLESMVVTRGTEAAIHGAGALGGVLHLNPLTPGASHDLEPKRSLTARGDSLESVGTAAGWRGTDGNVRAAAGIDLYASRGTFEYERLLTPNIPDASWSTQERDNNNLLSGSGILSTSVPASGGHLQITAFGHKNRRDVAGMVGFPSPGATSDTTRSLLGGIFTSDPVGNRSVRWSAATWMSGDGYEYEPGENPAPGLGSPFTNSRRVIGLRSSAEALVAGTALQISGEASMEMLSGTGAATTRPAASLLVSDTAFLANDLLTLHGGIRLDAFGGHPATLSPRFGANITLPASIVLSANVGRGVRMPTLFELHGSTALIANNDELQPESAVTFDGGVELAQDQVHLRVMGWHSRYRDLITYELFPPLRLRPFNVGEALTRGLEAEAKWRPTDWLSASCAYTLTDAVNLSPKPNVHGQTLPYRPRHRGFAGVTASIGRLDINSDLEVQSSAPRNRANTRSIPGRTLFGAGAEVGIRRNLSVGLHVANLLNDRRLEDLYGYPLPGRTAFFVVNLQG